LGNRRYRGERKGEFAGHFVLGSGGEKRKFGFPGFLLRYLLRGPPGENKKWPNGEVEEKGGEGKKKDLVNLKKGGGILFGFCCDPPHKKKVLFPGLLSEFCS